ncbi:MAG: cyclic nucleotide-binding domain-containing protein [Defluviitaleaceae bacterium]|nr:cyclic nucleotide-binding domain-containing protein [Defluviitaleaceae bacterium]
MADFTRGSLICTKGEPLSNILIITKGSVEAAAGGQTYTFVQGDIIGLEALIDGGYGFTYTAASDVSLIMLPFGGVSVLGTLFREKEDVASVIVNSAIRQANMYLAYHEALRQEAAAAYALVTSAYPAYERLCTTYAFTSKRLPAMDMVTSPESGVSIWAYEYYNGIRELEPTQKALFSRPGIALGFVMGIAEEISRAKTAIDYYEKYIALISKVLLSSAGLDLFSLVTELHAASVKISGADAAMDALITPIITTLSSMNSIEQEYFKQRQATYRDSLAASREGKKAPEQRTGEKRNLSDSLNIILNYSGCPAEQASKFTRALNEYTKASDRTSSDDHMHRLRRELTQDFNLIYKEVFIKSLKEPNPPTIIKMFLNFGYMDAALAGYENADYLYSLADSLCGEPEKGVYTAREWLTAIYTGKKEPCRNEFDMDYAAHVAEQKQQKKFDAKEEARLLADRDLKLKFEIENIFPIVNKLTFGRITTFCPIFSDNNVQRGLDSSMVTADAIYTALREITAVDFGAFYRETLYTNPEAGITRENVNVEILPDIILMPNVGSRGIMWQEIEGRKRTTRGRMFIPLFLLTELKPLLIRLAGEFRWEMCKRIQGSRWQDITEQSLTGEYYDYLQFYRTNRDISTEVKVQIKQELTRARNNYKAVFVSNYTDWVLYEANGTPRLNKTARKIMMFHCPFALSYREALAQNPQFSESLKRFSFQNSQRESYLQRLIAKLGQSGKVPQEITDELEFVKS